MYLKFICVGITVILLSACQSTSLSQQAFGVKLPLYQNTKIENSAKILFSADKKYESEDGVPFLGEPVVCTSQGLQTTIGEGIRNESIQVPANKEVIISSIIKWHNSGWEKSCWPFVSFIPESNSEYVLVNERIGGKGISALWTGVAFQSCKVSVFKIEGESFSRIQTQERAKPSCG